MSSGGAFWILGTEVVVSAAFFAVAGIYLGKITDHANDGCLLAIVNILAALCGAGVGFLCAKYPIFLLTTLAGTLVFPFASTMIALFRFKARR